MLYEHYYACHHVRNLAPYGLLTYCAEDQKIQPILFLKSDSFLLALLTPTQVNLMPLQIVLQLPMNVCIVFFFTYPCTPFN